MAAVGIGVGDEVVCFAGWGVTSTPHNVSMVLSNELLQIVSFIQAALT